MTNRTPRLNWTPELIHKFREGHRFSHANFGRAMGSTGALGVRKYSRQSVHAWEIGEYMPSIDALRALDVLAEREAFTG
jgi:DNA-binding transcriptional regulator YiaG